VALLLFFRPWETRPSQQPQQPPATEAEKTPATELEEPKPPPKVEEPPKAASPPAAAPPGPEPQAPPPAEAEKPPELAKPVRPFASWSLDRLVLALGSKSKTEVYRAQKELWVRGAESIPVLVNTLYSPQREQWINAGWVLIWIGDPAFDPLKEELRDCEDSNVQFRIACVLRHIGSAYPRLKEIVKDYDLCEKAKRILEEIEKDSLDGAPQAPSSSPSAPPTPAPAQQPPAAVPPAAPVPEPSGPAPGAEAGEIAGHP